MILDTNAMSALAAKDPAIISKLREARNISVTLVSLGEYKFGLHYSTKRDELQTWLERFMQRARLLCPDPETSNHYAAVRAELKAAGTPIPANDCWIAALTRQYSMPILSRDHHFDVVDNIRRIQW